jgi:hypothetical protein
MAETGTSYDPEIVNFSDRFGSSLAAGGIQGMSAAATKRPPRGKITPL